MTFCIRICRNCISLGSQTTFKQYLSFLFPSHFKCQNLSIFNKSLTRPASTTTDRIRDVRKVKDKLPDIEETDLEEQFVKGSGPGGQSVNKTNNCIILKHLPTGLTVKCHQTRSQEDNRRLARLQLRIKLDEHLNGENSAMSLLKQQQLKKRLEKKRKTKVRLEKLRAMKEMQKELKERGPHEP